jgi:pSer/pThr/pTyr-binding forkhead associated (FHA) protein
MNRHQDGAEEAAGSASGTCLESAEEIRQAVKAVRTPTLREAAGVADTLPFRPVRRPPMALLCILDDGKEEGQWIRVRGSQLVIGRSEGDIVIPHDDLISARHAELIRQFEHGRHRWYLHDLNSTNGVFVRVTRAILRHGQELMIGGGRYRFVAAPRGSDPASDEDEVPEDRSRGTCGWKSIAATDLLPSLVERTADGDGKEFLLARPDNVIGRDPAQCSVVLADDLLVSPRHARLHRDAKGRWHLDNCGSLNGTWLRIGKIALEGTGQFQLGEQRFLVRAL